MNVIKLGLSLLGAGFLALGVYQVAEAASCLGPRHLWSDDSKCRAGTDGGTDRGFSHGYNDGTQYLCVDSRGSDTAYVDSFGYTATGVRQTQCNPVGSGCCGHDCDRTGCANAVLHDYYAAW
jgi:hypothetical protein